MFHTKLALLVAAIDSNYVNTSVTVKHVHFASIKFSRFS